MCGVVPVPPEAKLQGGDAAREPAMNSPRVRAGSEGWTSTMLADWNVAAIGEKSRAGS